MPKAPVNVFLSHKSEDGAMARAIKTDLEAPCQDRLEVFVAEAMPAGVPWQEQIYEAIAKAKLFVFMHTGPRKSWDWPLFEVGLFIDPKTPGDEDHVVCIHHEATKRLDPIERYQSISVSSENTEVLEDFLRSFYGEADYLGLDEPLCESLANDDNAIKIKAEGIARHFEEAAHKPHFPHMRLVLDFTEEEQIERLLKDRIIDDTVTLTRDDQKTLPRLFGFDVQGEGTWGEIVERSRRRGFESWCHELGEACAEAAANSTEVTISSTLRTVEGAAIYRPILYRSDLFGQTRRRFHILFEKETVPHNIAGNDRLGRLFKMMRLGHRFRSEVLETYAGKMGDLADEQGVEQACRRLKEVIELIEADAASEDLLEEFTLTAPLDDGDGKEHVRGMLEEWTSTLRTQLFEALEAEDIATVEARLTELADQNKRYLAICSDTYARHAGEDAGEGAGGS